MIKVLISASSRYPVNRKRIRKLVEDILGERTAGRDFELSILFAGDRKIKNLNKRYRKINEVTDVLSFPLNETKFPDKVLRLGDIIISYPQARKQAGLSNTIVDEEIDRLVEHGLFSLLGLHDKNKN